MPKFPFLTTKLDKSTPSTETKAPAHGEKTVQTESDAKPKGLENQPAPEKSMIERTAKNTEEVITKEKEKAILDTLENRSKLEEIAGDPNSENPIMKSLQMHMSKRTFNAFRGMMRTLKPEVLRNLDQGMFGFKIKALYGEDKKYQNLSPRQQNNIELFAGRLPSDLRLKADVILNNIVERSEKGIDEVKTNLSFGSFTDEVDFHCHLIEFNQRAEAEGQDLRVALENYTKALQIINENALNGNTELSLADLDLILLPPEIGQLKELQALWLSGNKLTTLPPEFGQLRKLERLSLERNKLTSLPPEFGELEKLATFNVAVNNLTTLPPEIGQLKQLREFTPDYNQLTSLPHEIGQLKQLKVLGISQNQLTSLPPEIGQLENLERLDVRQNPLTSIPNELLTLKKLNVLSIPNLPDYQGIINELKENIGDGMFVETN